MEVPGLHNERTTPLLKKAYSQWGQREDRAHRKDGNGAIQSEIGGAIVYQKAEEAEEGLGGSRGLGTTAVRTFQHFPKVNLARHDSLTRTLRKNVKGSNGKTDVWRCIPE